MNSGGFVKGDNNISPDGRRDRWQAHRLARRAEIVAAAVRAIHRGGAGIAMQDIAAEAKVSKPVLYRHFTDQADLYHAIGKQAAEWLIDWLTRHLKPGDEPPVIIAGVVDAYLRAIEAEPELYRFVIRYAFADQSDTVDGYREIVVQHVEQVLRDRLAAIGADTSACPAWARGLVGMVQNTGEWWLDHPGEVTRPQLTRQLTALIWGGVSAALRE